MDRMSLVIVNYNSGEALARCVASVIDRDDVATEVVVVDNGSTDGSAAGLAERFRGLRLIATGANWGYAAATNRGLAAATTCWIGLLNPDTEVPPGALGALLAVLREHSGVGVVGPCLRWPDGTAQPYSHGDDPSPLYLLRRALARQLGRALHSWEGGSPRPVDWVSGACLITCRDVVERVGPFDERFFLYFEDVDWCRRCRQAGWSVLFVPGVSVCHLSRPDQRDRVRRAWYRESLRQFYRKHYGLLANLALTVARRLA